MKDILGKTKKILRSGGRIWRAFLAATVLSALFLTGCGGEETVKVERIDTAMGTIVRQILYVRQSPEDGDFMDSAGDHTAFVEAADIMGKRIAEAVRDEILALEKDMISWRLESSEIYKLNQSAGTEYEASPELAELLDRLLEISRSSGGALDITIGDVARLWDIDTAAAEPERPYTRPGKESIEAALKKTGYEKVRIEGRRILLPEGMKLDLGAVGKGLACGRIAGYLEECEEVTGAVISVGGSILTFGEKPDRTPWKVSIVDPMDTSRSLGYLELEGQWCVSTSGDYERYVEADGVRYHHILDPSDGEPAESGVKSVTILSGDGLLSDALSTACFVLGVEEGMALTDRYGAQGLFVDADGKLHMTEGMEQYFHGGTP